jgi:hypothetical protein
MGSFGWVAALLGLAGVLRRNPEWHAWGELTRYAAILAYMAFAGFGHLHWWRMLRAPKKVEAVDWDS